MAIDANKRKRRQRQSEAFNASIGSTHLEAIIKTTELHAIEPTPFGATTHPSFREAFWFWLKLGLIGLGDPQAKSQSCQPSPPQRHPCLSFCDELFREALLAGIKPAPAFLYFTSVEEIGMS